MPTPGADAPAAVAADTTMAWRWVQGPDDGEFPLVRDVDTYDNIRYQFLVAEDGDHATVRSHRVQPRRESDDRHRSRR